MRIITFCTTFCCLAILVQSAEDHRPSRKKKEKRQLDYSLAQPYPAALNFRSERRLPTGPQHPPHYPPPQYYPGPPRPYRKGRPHYLPAPPYAVQMEPLIHYSQRDPLYDTNTLSPDTDASQELSNNHVSDPVDRGESGDTIYIPHKPLIKVVEKPVYIKEPEPIIEIIIKESNITLPAPPPEAPILQKKKKEEVQVFYVKYKKNPHGHGKDAVIYDKPIPAISPIVKDDPEPEEQWNEPPPSNYGSYISDVTEPPKPSTTLRTIIKPDSEIYHSPGNSIKVTFGKEGFDYGKRSSKPEDYPGPSRQEEQVPRARQLSSFSDVYFKRPANNYFPASSNEYRTEVRPPQPYRPFNNFPPPPSSNQFNSRPPNRDYNSRPPPSFFPPPQSPKYPFQTPPYTKPSNSPQPSHSGNSQSSRTSFPSFSHSIAHPPPPHFQSQSKPSFVSAPPPRFQSQPQIHEISPPNQRKPVPYTPFESIRPAAPSFSQPLPLHEPQQSFNQPRPTQPTTHHQTPAQSHPGQIQFRPETRFNVQQSAQPPSFSEVNSQFKAIDQHQLEPQQVFHEPPRQPIHQPNQYQEHQNNLRTVSKVIPAGGELLQSFPRFEQHLVVDPTTGQNLPINEAGKQNFNIPLKIPQQHQQEFGRANKQVKQVAQNPPSPSQYVQDFSQYTNLVNRQQLDQFTRQSVISTYSTTTQRPTTTTEEAEKPSTTTKDPKILEAQLPDEVPEDLRQQLLSSGILNNADISILDYDKIGDIPLSALPPEQLANFYGAGGAQQLAAAGSEPLPQAAALSARSDVIPSVQDQEMSAEETEISEVAVKPNEGVEMKVVKYNPETDKGQKVQEAYISDSAKQLDPVVLNDNSYNRYLPLKINGTQFPIPDVPELKGKLISSVVVLAPITYDFSSTRKTREAAPSDEIQLIQNEPLKELLADPSRENYKKFLENEGKTSVAKQSVILLVAGTKESSGQEKEIYMYDIASRTVSKLDGELSSAFVDAAEANSSDSKALQENGKPGSPKEASSQLSSHQTSRIS
ncbi:YLP motif-containing protein 1-like isoform X1 [Euwallacea fornicatus]|uniref:YLP motif-containing protein 1-like isoform X1 n=1 Tax=Euwallacea fornicatus TaxID=995702 RepID=UPI00338E88FD